MLVHAASEVYYYLRIINFQEPFIPQNDDGPASVCVSEIPLFLSTPFINAEILGKFVFKSVKCTQ